MVVLSNTETNHASNAAKKIQAGLPEGHEAGVYGINGLVFNHPASSQLATHRFAPDRTTSPRALSADTATSTDVWGERELTPRYHADDLSRNEERLKALDEFLATFDDEQSFADATV
ncbi:MAG: hypothetical protein O3C40_19300 [Planctomycetota bacterium]|nr:hypothetical protein [Planctomycetota bacterium]